jgi:hypothetical protein
MFISTSLSCGSANENANSSYCYGAYKCKLRFIGDLKGEKGIGNKEGTAFCQPNKNKTCPHPAECVTRPFNEGEVKATVLKEDRIQTSEQALAEIQNSKTHNATPTDVHASVANPSRPEKK